MAKGFPLGGVVGPPTPVPVGQCGGTVPAVSREEPLGMALAQSHDLGSLGDGQLIFQNAVEYLDPCLFLLIQLYIPHRDDIFADQLAGDLIVEQQQLYFRYSSQWVDRLTLYGCARVSVREPKAATSSGVTGRTETARAWTHSSKERQAEAYITRVLAETLRSRASSMRQRSLPVRPVASVGRRPWRDGWETGVAGFCRVISALDPRVLSSRYGTKWRGPSR